MQRPLDLLYQWFDATLAAQLDNVYIPDLEAIADRIGDNPDLDGLLEDMSRDERAIYDLILRRYAQKPSRKVKVAIALAASIAYQRGLTMSEPKGGRDGGQPEPQGF